MGLASGHSILEVAENSALCRTQSCRQDIGDWTCRTPDLWVKQALHLEKCGTPTAASVYGWVLL